jgi:hypothetical protein
VGFANGDLASPRPVRHRKTRVGGRRGRRAHLFVPHPAWALSRALAQSANRAARAAFFPIGKILPSIDLCNSNQEAQSTERKCWH